MQRNPTPQQPLRPAAHPCAPCRDRVARRILLEVAPVLSGVKPAALLSLDDCECGASGRAERVFCSRRSRLAAATGLSVRVLRRTGRGCQALFFDAGLLAARLAEPDAAAFLRARGWPAEPPAALGRLADAFADAPGDCPPEVGIFLGYPVRDVAGFIERPAEALPTRGTLWRVLRAGGRVPPPHGPDPARPRPRDASPCAGERRPARRRDAPPPSLGRGLTPRHGFPKQHNPNNQRNPT